VLGIIDSAPFQMRTTLESAAGATRIATATPQGAAVGAP